MTYLFSTACFAPIPYYACLLKCDAGLMDRFHQTADIAMIEQHEHYHKQTYRNRCIIASANGPLALSVPVILKNDQPIRDVRIDYSNDWIRQHWISITSAYNSTPYFEYYQDDLLDVFRQHHTFLFDFNEAMREVICSLVDFRPTCRLSDDYIPEGGMADTCDLRNVIHPKKNLVLNGYKSIPYPQVFEGRSGFQPGLSILDLLFNMGPESLVVLKKSIMP